jgi:hypothetical protein
MSYSSSKFSVSPLCQILAPFFAGFLEGEENNRKVAGLENSRRESVFPR